MPIYNAINKSLSEKMLLLNKKHLASSDNYDLSHFISNDIYVDDDVEHYANMGGAKEDEDEDYDIEEYVLKTKKGKPTLVKASGGPIEYDGKTSISSIVPSQGESFMTPQEKLDHVLQNGGDIKKTAKRVKSVAKSVNKVLTKKDDVNDVLNILTIGRMHEQLGKAKDDVNVDDFKKKEAGRRKKTAKLDDPEMLKKMGVKIIKKGSAEEVKGGVQIFTDKKRPKSIIGSVLSSIGLGVDKLNKEKKKEEKEMKKKEKMESKKKGKGIISGLLADIGLGKKEDKPSKKKGKGIISGLLADIGLGKNEGGSKEKLTPKEDLPPSNMFGRSSGKTWKETIVDVRKENPGRPMKEIFKIAKTKYVKK